MFPGNWRPATWAGVDLFFVLSGYLIGTQWLRPYIRREQPSYWHFFVRRALRVLPAYFTVLAVYFFIPGFRESPRLAPIWRFLTFTLNFGLDSSKTGAFTHAWSLCVEEHFYLLLPVIVSLLMRRPSFKLTATVAAVILVGGMILRAFLWLHYVQPLVKMHHPQLGPLFLNYIYYPTYNRLDGLLVGVLIAAVRLFRRDAWEQIARRGNGVLLAGVVVLLGAFTICQEMRSFATSVFGYPLLAVGFGLILVAGLSPHCILAKPRFFGSTLVAALSFCVYLTHKEMMHLDEVYLNSWLVRTGLLRLGIYLLSFWIAAELLHRTAERFGYRLRERLLLS